MRPRLLIILASLMLTAAVPGCGGKGDGGSGTTSGTISPTGTRTSPRKAGSPVGRVLTVVLPNAFIQGQKAFDEDPIRARQSVSTNGKGSVDFGLKKKLKTCRLFQNSEVVAAPAGGALLRYQAGTAWCFTTTNPSKGVVVGPSNVEFVMSDPLFGVTVTDTGTTLRVVQGVVEVRSSTGGGPSLLVGPDQLVTIVGGEVPTTAEGFSPEDLPKFEADTVSLFRTIAPDPNFGPPEPDGSAGLQRILEATNTIRVGIDSTFAGDPSQETDTEDWDFVDFFFSLLSDFWKVTSAPSALASEGAGRALQEGTIDVFVTPEPSPEFASFPLFGGLDGRTWSVSFVGADPQLGAALRDFVRATLQQKDYVITYKGAFGIDHPPLEPIRPLLGF
jgi:hypothetical protein